MSDERQIPGFAGGGGISAAQLDELLRCVEGLPASPAAVAELLALPNPPAADAQAETAQATAAIVRADVALAAAALAAANRTDPRAAATVDDACRLLAPAGVRHIALTAQLAGQAPASADAIDLPGLRVHALAVAHAARALAVDTCPDAKAELAYTCGLLHDVGKWLLADLFPKTYLQILDSVRLGEVDLLEAERRILGLDHAVAGRRLARHWRLGDAVEETAWFSHQPLEAVPALLDHGPIVRLVALADVLVRERGIGFSGNGAPGRGSGSLAEQMNISADVLARAGEAAVAAADAANREAASGGGERSCVRSLTRANAELGRTCQALSGQVAALQWQADALERLQRLMRSLPADATVRDVLAGLADAIAQAVGEGGPVVVYCTGPRGSAQAVRLDAANGSAWLTLDAAQAWLAPGAGRHVELTSGGQVVGGWIVPERPDAANARAGREVDALAPAAGVLLHLAAERAAAVELGEALAASARDVAVTQQALAQANALAGVGEMAAGAAHELNNPLAVISGRAQLLREKTDSDDVRRTCQIIVDQAQRVSDIVSSLMELATPATANGQPLDVAGLLASAARAFYSSEHPKAASAHVDIVCGQDTPPVIADEQQIRAVLVEAVANAATAAPDSPHVTLTAEIDEAAHAVVLSIRDDGPGMDEQTLARVFTPFFSAQRAGRRPGMGLPRARRLVQANRGRIWIRTKAGEGTTVYVQLPQA